MQGRSTQLKSQGMHNLLLLLQIRIKAMLPVRENSVDFSKAYDDILLTQSPQQRDDATLLWSKG